MVAVRQRGKLRHQQSPVREPSEAAERLGVTTKALRLYEERGTADHGAHCGGTTGLIVLMRFFEVLRGVVPRRCALGLSLAEVEQAFGGDRPRPRIRSQVRTRSAFKRELRELVCSIDKIRLGFRRVLPRAARAGRLESRLVGETPPATFDAALICLGHGVANGSSFRDVRAINCIIGPVASGKTRLAMRSAETLPDAEFFELGAGRRRGACRAS